MSEQSVLIVVVLVMGALAGIALERFRRELARHKWRARKYQKPTADQSRTITALPSRDSAAFDATEQLRIVMSAHYQVQPILNKSEARLFRELDHLVLSRKPDWQVMAQVSLGEILRTRDAQAYACVNSKRVDLLLIDENCHPRHAIEYQGAGHHQGTAAARDAIKKEALRRAGISYHEVVGGETTPADLRRLVEKLLDAA